MVSADGQPCARANATFKVAAKAATGAAPA
jgi:hypothetical protein